MVKKKKPVAKKVVKKNATPPSKGKCEMPFNIVLCLDGELDVVEYFGTSADDALQKYLKDTTRDRVDLIADMWGNTVAFESKPIFLSRDASSYAYEELERRDSASEELESLRRRLDSFGAFRAAKDLITDLEHQIAELENAAD